MSRNIGTRRNFHFNDLEFDREAHIRQDRTPVRLSSLCLESLYLKAQPMPKKTYYFEQIEKELATAREALKTGNEGKARVCARRAAGQAIVWFMTKFPRPDWGADALSQLAHLQDDRTFPREIRDAAVRLTTKISDRFTYPFTSKPVDDARLIVGHIETIMEPDAD